MKTVECSYFIRLLHADDDHLRVNRLHDEGDIDLLFLKDTCDPREAPWEIDILTTDIEIRMIFDRQRRGETTSCFEFPEVGEKCFRKRYTIKGWELFLGYSDTDLRLTRHDIINADIFLSEEVVYILSISRSIELIGSYSEYMQ